MGRVSLVKLGSASKKLISHFWTGEVFVLDNSQLPTSSSKPMHGLSKFEDRC